jgi:hypothetical protein
MQNFQDWLRRRAQLPHLSQKKKKEKKKRRNRVDSKIFSLQNAI